MNEIIDRIKCTTKPLYIRFGFGWKGAEWNQTTTEHLINTLQNGNYAKYDVTTVNNGIGIAFYSSNDML